MTRDDGLRSPMYAGSWPYTLYTGTNDYLIEKGTHDVHAFVDWLRLLVERLPSRGRYTQAGVLTPPPLVLRTSTSLLSSTKFHFLNCRNKGKNIYTVPNTPFRLSYIIFMYNSTTDKNGRTEICLNFTLNISY